MDYVIHIFYSFMATACFGVMFNAPINAIPFCGFVGSFGWTIYYTLMKLGVQEVQATFAGAFAIALVAQYFAQKLKMPMIIFNVSGIIPLVPGGIAFNTMRNIVELEYNLGVQNGMRVIMISGAIAMGLVFAEVITHLVMKMLRKGRTSLQTYHKEEKDG